MCHSNGSVFHNKSLNMGLIFYKNIPKHGSVFSKISKKFGCSKCEHPKIVKNRPIFQGKSLKMGTMLPKWPLNMGRGFKAQAADPCPNQIWVPPGFNAYLLVTYINMGECATTFTELKCKPEIALMTLPTRNLATTTTLTFRIQDPLLDP